MVRRLAAVALACGLGACGGKHPPPPPPDAGATACTPGGDGGYLTTPFPELSDYCFVSIQDGGIAFDPSVVPYDLNTPLYSDEAVKVRGLWLPSGTQATYDPTLAFEFPVGAILIKSFGFADDQRKASPHITWVETRLMIHQPSGWEAYTYVWNADGTAADLSYAGMGVPLQFIDADGGSVSTVYTIPDFAQCKECHTLDGGVTPIGPKARQLNRSFAYEGGAENELAHWTRLGILSGAPAATDWPLLPVWNDPSTGTTEQRARAYLEGNCAHCHNLGGYASNTGLYLFASETSQSTIGLCKTPVAAGPATGGNQYDIVPGDPTHSIVVFRMSSLTADVAMPQIERNLVDDDGVALVSEWIASLDGGCL